MATIFISYRREDSENVAGRLAEDLKARFGNESVFFDIDSIPLGVNFTTYLDENLSCCDVVLAIIGRDWVDALDEDGARRLDDPSDYLRNEIEWALGREIPVVPVLVRRAAMPKHSELPESLRPLVLRNGHVIGARDYEHHVKQLGDGLEGIPFRGQDRPDVDGSNAAARDAYASTFEMFLSNDGVIDEKEAASLKLIAQSSELSDEEQQAIEAEVREQLGAEAPNSDGDGSSVNDGVTGKPPPLPDRSPAGAEKPPLPAETPGPGVMTVTVEADRGADNRQLDLGETFSLGWATFRGNWLSLMTGTILAFLVTCCTLFFCAGPVWIGLTRMCLNAASGRPVSAWQVFSGFNSFWSAFRLSCYFMVLNSSCRTFNYLCAWAPELMVDDELDPEACLKRSFDLNVANIGPVLMFGFRSDLLVYGGFLLFFLTWPLAGCISAHGYLRTHGDKTA